MRPLATGRRAARPGDPRLSCRDGRMAPDPATRPGTGHPTGPPPRNRAVRRSVAVLATSRRRTAADPITPPSEERGRP
jgi:hypothetical protein